MFHLYAFLPLIFIPLAFAVCSDPDIPWNNYCYVFTAIPEKFAGAEMTCTKLGGHLASIHDAFTDALLTDGTNKNFSQSNVWIGATNLQDTSAWTWTDGTPFDFKEWKTGEPNDQNQYACATLSSQNGYWTAQNCFDQFSFVCAIPDGVIVSTTLTPLLTTTTPRNSPTSTVIHEKSTSNSILLTHPLTTSFPLSTVTTVTSTGSHFYNCSRNWIYFEPTQSCYLIFNSATVTWESAKSTCIKNNAQLPSLHTFEELQFLHTFIDITGVPMWLGLSSNNGGKSWSYTDGSSVDYLPWLFGKPNITDGQITVAIASNPNNLLEGGIQPLNYAVPFCQKRIPFDPTPPPPASFHNCSLGWTYFEPARACYGGVNGAQGRTDWNGAESYCRDLGGHLPSILSYEELAYAFEFALMDNWSGNLWVGLSFNGTNWIWSDGTPATYLPGLENITGQANNCGYIKSSHGDYAFSSTQCSQATAFVCKKKLIEQKN